MQDLDASAHISLFTDQIWIFRVKNVFQNLLFIPEIVIITLMQ